MMLKAKPDDFIVEEIPLFEPINKGRYTYFILEKKEYNSEDAIDAISKHFNIERKNFSYAGNKDRNAITRQYVTVRGDIRNCELNDISVNRLGYLDRPISLGDLKGNRFEIVIRDIEKKPEKISETVNYFDEQRFGRHNLKIGMGILKGDFKEASSHIDYVEVKDHLRKNPNDFVGAIRKVPFKTLKLFIHSVQSLLWNEVALRYVKQHPHTIVENGDVSFAFPKGSIKDISLPLITFDTDFDAISERLYEPVLEKHGLVLRDFIIRPIPDITPRGGERNLISTVHDLKIGELEDDEITGKKKIKVSFWLDKGCYATIAIKKMFKINS